MKTVGMEKKGLSTKFGGPCTMETKCPFTGGKGLIRATFVEQVQSSGEWKDTDASVSTLISIGAVCKMRKMRIKPRLQDNTGRHWRPIAAHSPSGASISL